MAIINASYFNGEINIPNTDKAPVLDLLYQFIEKYEPELLQRIFGYGFYKDFTAGIQTDPIPQKWVDLLLGVDYTYGGISRRWRGMIEGYANIINALEFLSGSTMIQVGRGGTYDPVVGASSVTIPLSVQGKPFKIYQRGFGELADDEYTISEDGTTLTLTQWTFSGNDRYFYHAASVTSSDGDATPKYSFIANCIYYWYIRNNSTVTTDGGEKHSEAENAARSNPSLKMSRAWNEAVNWINEMYCYLNASRTTYDTWKPEQARPLRKINAFSI